ncbi:ParB/RepB/Spo0J family partition protein [Adlercreutzia equolifaciens]|uniref:ParB/RepB/Spo0J family partition protein n=1 Tax=Adlercreutzia equolifaciens TaxID=446660 RepID=UPI003AB0FBB1
MARATASGFTISGLLDKNAATRSDYPVERIPVGEIADHPENTAYSMDDAGIAQLAKSIEKEGLTDLPLVRKLDDGSWQMVSGHRRKAAYAMLAEEDERYAQIPCRIIRGISDEQSVMLLHAANYFVRNLTVTERAAASRALGMEVERMRVENPELSGMRTEDIKAAIISEQTGRKVSGKTIQRQESLARKIEEDLVAGWREAALSDSLSADAVNALAKMEPDEQERLFSSWKEHPLDKKKTTEFLRKATSEPSANLQHKEDPKPSAPLGSALRALKRYESKAPNEPSGLDRQALEEIAGMADRLLGRI